MSGKTQSNMPQITGIVLECVKCGHQFDAGEMEWRGPEVKCINCGHRVLRKMRPPVVRKVKAI